MRGINLLESVAYLGNSRATWPTIQRRSERSEDVRKAARFPRLTDAKIRPFQWVKCFEVDDPYDLRPLARGSMTSVGPDIKEVRAREEPGSFDDLSRGATRPEGFMCAALLLEESATYQPFGSGLGDA